MAKSLEDLTVDELLAHAKRLEPAANLFQALQSDPGTRETLQRAIKKIAPQTSIPEIDARDAVSAEIKTERDARLALEQKIMERDIRDRLEKQRASIISKHSLSEADMAEVEKLMTREVDPIPTYEGAALVYKASKQSATPTPASFQRPVFEMPEKDVWGAGIGNKAKLDRIGLNEAYKAMEELGLGKAN